MSNRRQNGRSGHSLLAVDMIATLTCTTGTKTGGRLCGLDRHLVQEAERFWRQDHGQQP